MMVFNGKPKDEIGRMVPEYGLSSENIKPDTVYG